MARLFSMQASTFKPNKGELHYQPKGTETTMNRAYFSCKPGVSSVFIAMLLVLLSSLGSALPVLAQSHTAQPVTWNILVGVDNKDHSITGMAYLTPEIWIDAGDTITWAANSGEPHTVAFLATGQKQPKLYNPISTTENNPQGGSSYDGSSFYNSGQMSLFFGSQSYSLTFPVTGDFKYICFVHPMMTPGIVHVRSAGTSYPHTQAYYNEKAQDLGNALINDGYGLLEDMREESDSHHVTIGATDGMAMVMRFVPSTINLHVGSTVTFIDRTPTDDPHTVSFGTPQGNKFPVVPYGDSNNFTGQPLNSGLVGSQTDWKVPFQGKLQGNKYTVTFNLAGTYQFFCAIHQTMAVNITVS